MFLKVKKLQKYAKIYVWIYVITISIKILVIKTSTASHQDLTKYLGHQDLDYLGLDNKPSRPSNLVHEMESKIVLFDLI